MSLFIPEKIKVGYQYRQGTYTGKLAYVIYFDETGKLRKETSWERWRDKKIDSDEFENEPTEGFVLNKDVQRCNWSHFGSGRSYIRVYDPRGIEFEITPENLIGILMEADCNRRALIGQFVYAWKGTELLLLPCGSESYTEAKKFTKKQQQKISARDLKPGCSYTLKRANETKWIYLGRFHWYTWSPSGRKGKKYHIFWDGKGFVRAGDTKQLAYLDNEEPVSNYAELVDKFKNDPISQKIIDVEITPVPLERINLKSRQYGGYIPHSVFKKVGENIIEYHINYMDSYRATKQELERTKFYMEESKEMNIKTLTYVYVPRSSTWYAYNPSRYNKGYTEQEILDQCKDTVMVNLVLESGKKYRLKSIDSWELPGGRY